MKPLTRAVRRHLAGAKRELNEIYEATYDRSGMQQEITGFFKENIRLVQLDLKEPIPKPSWQVAEDHFSSFYALICAHMLGQQDSAEWRLYPLTARFADYTEAEEISGFFAIMLLNRTVLPRFSTFDGRSVTGASGDWTAHFDPLEVELEWIINKWFDALGANITDGAAGFCIYPFNPENEAETPDAFLEYQYLAFHPQARSRPRLIT